jgi:predicted  nucleic acid-binding Zn-ribbon protein
LKEEAALNEKIKILEKEIGTLTEKLDAMSRDLQEISDLRNEIKGLKLFLGRIHPEFKTKFPEIMEKVFKKR